jgi:acetyl esterase/lipase
MSISSDISLLPGIVYTSGTSRPHALDLYLPPDPAGAPVLLYLHGGAWITGARDETATRLKRIAEAGLTVASIDYTFVQDAPFPAQLADILTAAAWLTENRERFGYEPGETILGGASAGGHLATLSALLLSDPGVDTAALPDGFRIAGALSLFASLDLTAGKPVVDPARGLRVPAMVANAPVPEFFAGVHPSPRRRAALLAGVTEDELDEKILAAYSPLHRLHAALPRTLLLHGTADAMVPAEQSIRFRDAAGRIGASVELELVEGANHEGVEFESPRIATRIAEFALDGARGRAHG